MLYGLANDVSVIGGLAGGGNGAVCENK